MAFTIDNSNFANLRIRQGTRPNIGVENYIQAGGEVIHDFGPGGSNPLKYQNWYISYSFRKDDVPGSLYTPSQKLPMDEDGLAGLGRVRVVFESTNPLQKQHLISDMGFALDLVRFFPDGYNVPAGTSPLSWYYSVYPCAGWPNPPYNLPPWVPSGSHPVDDSYQGDWTMYNTHPAYTLGQIPLNISGTPQEKYYKEIWAPATHNNSFLTYPVPSKTYNKNKWETLVVLNDTALITWEHVYYDGSGTGITAKPASVYTRMNHRPGWTGVINNMSSFTVNGGTFPISSYGGLFGTGLDGPYPDMQIDSPGAVDLKIYLFAHDSAGNTIASTTNPIYANASNIDPAHVEKAIAYKDFSFNTYQQAVSVTRKASGTGQILTNGISFNDPNAFGTVTTAQPIVLDKSTNRGDDLTSTWQFWKLNTISGSWEWITPGSGFHLGGGETVTSDTINLTFDDEGQYRIANYCIGSAGTLYNASSDAHEINIGLNTPMTPEIEWPDIISNVIESPLDLDPIISNNPLTGKQPFIIRTQAYVNINTGSFIWTDPDGIDPDVVRVMSEQDWIDEIEAKCYMYCYVYSNGQLAASRSGWGPHDIELTEGSYTVQFVAKYKSTIIQNQVITNPTT